jgi:NAD(P)-dependent dehydrogenase (short-subunit alcohol dehydrogenase family)
MQKLSGRSAIITGAAGGIGFSTAKLFLAEGASVVLVDRDAEALARCAAELDPARVAHVAADVSQPGDVARYVALAVERFGRIDVLFANAGIEGAVMPITEYPVDAFDRVLAVNLRGPFLAIQQAAPIMTKSGGGSIIVTSSVAGLIGSSGLSAYVTSKHGVIGLVRTAAVELAKSKIRVNALNPGPIENRMMRSIEEQASPGHAEAVKQGFTAMVPLGRYGTNEEMARLALFLASNDSAYCTGAVFVADGGFTAQ